MCTPVKVADLDMSLGRDILVRHLKGFDYLPKSTEIKMKYTEIKM